MFYLKKYISILIFLFLATAVVYLNFFASDRYVSEASVLVRKVDSISAPAIDIPSVVSGLGQSNGVNRPDQFLLREYLLSYDLLEKIDAELNLRLHFSDKNHDFFFRLKDPRAPKDLFLDYFRGMISVEYDDYGGVLKISVQSFEPEMSLSICKLLLKYGEQFMNGLSNDLAVAQVEFLINEVNSSQSNLQRAIFNFTEFQNANNLLTPETDAQSSNAIISKLEAQKSDFLTQMASLPKNLDRDHPTIVMLRNSIEGLNKQISDERVKLANSNGNALNVVMGQYQALKLQVDFYQDVYKASIAALEKGRFNASRSLEKISIIQSPILADRPTEPWRLYLTCLLLILSVILFFTARLFISIITDHLD